MINNIFIASLAFLPVISTVICFSILKKYKNMINECVVIKGRILDYRTDFTPLYRYSVHLNVKYTLDGEAFTGKCWIFRLGKLNPKRNEEMEFCYLPKDKSVLYSTKLSENVDYRNTTAALIASIALILLFTIPTALVLIYRFVM